MDCAVRLMAHDKRVMAVGLFGSLARREALPSSDADLLIVLKEHPQRRWFDRALDYADAFADASLPVDVFAYTLDELTRMASNHSGFLRCVLRDLVPLCGDQRVWEDLKQELSPRPLP